MNTFSAKDTKDVGILACLLSFDIPPENQINLATEIVVNGLMKPNLLICFLVWLVYVFKNLNKDEVWGRIFTQHPEFANSLIEQTVNHMLHGKDKTSSLSCGGFNQNEIDTLWIIVSKYRYKC